jgi:hypothetical protein
MIKKLPVLLASLLLAAAAASANEIVVLKGGKSLELSKPYVVRGSQAVMTLKDGTVVSVAAADIDLPATRAARRPIRVASDAPVAAATPVEAAKAQQKNPKAKVKIGDEDVNHTLEGAEPDAEAAPADGAPTEPEGDAKLDVVDFDQRPSGNAVAVKGTIRNSGGAAASNVALSVAAMDDTGKVVASAMASISAGTIEAGSAATFTASLPMAAKAATLRFTPRWSSPSPAANPVPGAATGTSAAPAGTATVAPAKKAAPPPPAPEKKEPTYKPQPDYAPPAANVPLVPTESGYIPAPHEETPPPPPPPPPPA